MRKNRHSLVFDVIKKEILEVALSFKFLFIFSTCTILILIASVVGANNYESRLNHYDISNSLMRETTSNQVSYQALGVWGEYKVFKPPSKLSGIVEGLEGFQGRSATMSVFREPVLESTQWNDEPIYAIFGSFSIFFIINVLASLFAIMMTYDSISGERENGTLKLLLSSKLSRTQLLLGKFFGSFVGLVLPLLAATIAGILVYDFIIGSAFTGEDWLRIAIFILACLLYISFFLALGIAVSSFSKNSSSSFLIALVLWAMIIWVLPLSATRYAGTSFPVPQPIEIEAKLNAIDRQAFKEIAAQESAWYRENPGQTLIPLDVSASFSKDVQANARDQKKIIESDFAQRQAQRQRYAENLSRVSPAACFALSSFNYALVDSFRQTRFLNAIKDYREEFGQYVSVKMREEQKLRLLGQLTGTEGIDISDMPVMSYKEEKVAESFSRGAMDLLLLALYTVIMFLISIIGFNRYDVRN